MIWYVDHGRNNAASSWEDLAWTLGGSFVARGRGMISPELILLTPEGEPFGRLTTDESGETEFQGGDLSARIESSPGEAYRMTTGGTETLTSEPAGSQTHLHLRSDDRLYEASISLLRNRATARSSTGSETARLSGGLTNRRYRATFDPQDPTSLPIAILLLHQTIKLRSKAYRARS